MESIVLVHGDGRMLEVTWDDRQVEFVETRDGEEDVRHRAFATPAEAREHVNELARSKRAEGFHEQRDETIARDENEENESLYARIAHDPDDVAARLVLADWLHERGHPRGELIALAHAAAEDPANAELSKRIEAHVAAHAESLFGDLWDQRDLFDAELRYGFADRVRLFRIPPSKRDLETKLLMMGFLAHPTCRFLRSLALSFADEGEYRGLCAELIEALVASRPMPTVRALQIGNPACYDTRVRVPNVARVLPNLRELAVFGGGAFLERARYDALETLVVWTGTDQPETGMEQCTLPSLGRIVVRGAALDPIVETFGKNLDVLELVFDRATSHALTAWSARAGLRLSGVREVVLSAHPIREVDVVVVAAAIESVAKHLRVDGVNVTTALTRSPVEAYVIANAPEPDFEGDDDDYEGEEDGDGDPISEPPSEREDAEEIEDEPGVDKDWEAPKENPLDVDEESRDDEVPDLIEES